MLLKQDPDGHGGYMHPPAFLLEQTGATFFTLGSPLSAESAGVMDTLTSPVGWGGAGFAGAQGVKPKTALCLRNATAVARRGI